MAAPQQYPVLKNVSKDDIILASDSEQYFATRQLSLGKLASYIHNWQGSTDLIDVTELRSDVDALELAIGGFQDQIDALDIRVTNLETRVTTAEGDILTLQSSVTNIDTTLVQQSSFNTDITNTVAEARIDIDANTSATSANASITQNVMTSIGTFDSEGNLIDVSESFANSVISSETGSGYATAQDLTNLEVEVKTYTDTQLTSYSTTSATAQMISTATADMATSQDLVVLESDIQTWTNGVLTSYSTTTATQQLITTATATKAEASDLTLLQTDVNNNTSEISNNATAISDESSARASAISSLTSTVNGNTASITTNANTISTVDGKLSASYSLTVNAGGAVAGLKLLSDGTTSSLKFQADQFKFENGAGTLTPFEIDAVNNKIAFTGDVIFSGGGDYGDADVQAYIDTVGEIFTSSTTISGGQITTGLIKNLAYANASGDGFSESGMAINLDAGSIHAEEFYVNADGTSSFSGSHTAGSIGNWVISGTNNLQSSSTNPNIVLAPSTYSVTGEKVVISADSLAQNAPVATFKADMASPSSGLIKGSGKTDGNFGSTYTEFSRTVRDYTVSGDLLISQQSVSVGTYSPPFENPNFKVSIPYGGNDTNIDVTFASKVTQLNQPATDNTYWGDSWGKNITGTDIIVPTLMTVATATLKVQIRPVISGAVYSGVGPSFFAPTVVYENTIYFTDSDSSITYTTNGLHYGDYPNTHPTIGTNQALNWTKDEPATWNSGQISVDLPNALPSSVISVGYEVEFVLTDIEIKCPSTFNFASLPSGFDFGAFRMKPPVHLGSTYNTTKVFDPNATSIAAFKGSDAQTLLGLNGVQLSGADGYVAMGDVASNGYLAEFYGDVQVVGQLEANSFVALSDERLKENICDIKDALEVISELQPKIYTWNKDVNPKAPSGTHIGFIAQDVQEVLPVVVERIGDVGSVKEVNAVRYNDITVLNTQGIKELLELVEELQTEIKQLKEQINGKN